MVQILRIEALATGPQRRCDDDRIMEGELAALHDLVGPIVVFDGERLRLADVAYRLQNLPDVSWRHSELPNRNRSEFVQHLNADDTGVRKERLDAVCLVTF